MAAGKAWRARVSRGGQGSPYKQPVTRCSPLKGARGEGVIPNTLDAQVYPEMELNACSPPPGSLIEYSQDSRFERTNLPSLISYHTGS